MKKKERLMKRLSSTAIDEKDNKKVEKKIKRLEEDFKFDYNDKIELTKDDKQKLAAIDKFKQIKWFVPACELVEGQTFGELALLYK